MYPNIYPHITWDFPFYGRGRRFRPLNLEASQPACGPAGCTESCSVTWPSLRRRNVAADPKPYTPNAQTLDPEPEALKAEKAFDDIVADQGFIQLMGLGVLRSERRFVWV